MESLTKKMTKKKKLIFTQLLGAFGEVKKTKKKKENSKTNSVIG